MKKLSSNIGQKIKTLAKVLLIIDCLAAIIVPIVLSIVLYFESGTNIWFIPVSIIGGLLISYVSFMFVYAFGELVDTNQQIARNTKK